MAQRLGSKLAQKLLKGSSNGKQAAYKVGAIEARPTARFPNGSPDPAKSKGVESGLWQQGETGNGQRVPGSLKGLYGRDVVPSSASTSGRGVAGFASSAWPGMPTPPSSMAPMYFKKGLTWVMFRIPVVQHFQVSALWNLMKHTLALNEHVCRWLVSFS
jgi:hypothetical protein